MKTTRTILSVILSLIFCLSLLPVPAFAAGNVTAVVAGGKSYLLDAAVTTEISVPVFYAEGVDVYEVPVITVTNGSETAALAVPEVLPAEVAVTIGGTAYNVSLKPRGANMYENGGSETGKTSNFMRGGGFAAGVAPMSITTLDAYSGSRSLVRPKAYSHDYVEYVLDGELIQPVLKAGKTYLSSYATRLHPNAMVTETNLDYRLMDAVRSSNKEQITAATFYQNNTLVGAITTPAAELWKNTGINLTYDWVQMQAVIKPETDFDVKHYSLDSGWATTRKHDLLLDDMFLSELSVGKVQVTDAEGETSAAVVTGRERTLALSGTILNQLGTKSGFEDEIFTWKASAGIIVDEERGIVTIPADAKPGVYTVTAQADVLTNGIGAVSGSYKIKVLSESVTLNTLAIEGVGKYTFDADKTDYEIGVPVRYNTAEGVDSYTYALPDVTATADDADVVIEAATTLPGTTKISLIDEDGFRVNTYTVNFVPLGANMYTNGGFEEEGIPFAATNRVTTEKITDNPTAGSSSVKMSFAATIAPMSPQQTLLAGKTYLSSRMIRKTENTVIADSTMNDFIPDSTTIRKKAYRIAYAMDQLPADSKAYISYSELTSSSSMLDNIKPDEAWKPLSAIITPSADYLDKQGFFLGSWSNAVTNELAVDNVFLGELIIGDVEVTGNGEAIPDSISTDSAVEYLLNGKVLNQLGSEAGLEGKISSIEFQKTEEWLSGATLENGTLKIAKNTSGKLTFKVVATVDSTAWVNAPQESFVNYISIDCFTKDMNEIYVATDGAEHATGSFDDPFKTLTSARDKIRDIRAAGGTQGITVYIRGGEYEMNEQLLLTEVDSGTAEAPVLWRNYGQEDVMLIGGKKVAGSAFTKVTEESVLNRIVDSSARSSVYRLDLKELGITDPGEPYYNGSYSYSSSLSEWITEPESSGIEIFYNGKAMTNARYPNEGTLTVGNVIEPGWNSDNPEACAKGTPFTISVADERITHWKEAESALMYGFWKWSWADQTIPIGSIDVQNKQITSKWHSVFSVEAGSPFYVYNLLEEMDQAGEYYIDRSNSLLYIIPPSDITEADITLSLLADDLIYINGADYVSFQGLSVQATRNSPFRIAGGTGCSVKNCEIFNAADYGVKLSGTDNVVSDCHIYDVNGGVSVSGGDEVTLTPANNQVLRCHIEAFARLDKTYKPAVNLGGIGNLAAFNKIHNAPHQAIAFGGNNNKMYYNEIFDVLQSTKDAGAIYGGLSWSSRGHEIKYNYIHDLESDQVPVVADGKIVIWGVFLDGAQCDVTVEGNIFENIKGDAVFVSGGRDNIVQNNYAINCVRMLRIIQSVLEEDLATSLHYSRIPSHVWKDGEWKNEAWKAAYPELYDMLMNLSDAEKVRPENNVFKNNLCYNTGLCTRNPDWLKEGYEAENYVTTEDPGFVSLGAEPDYSLKKNAAVLEVLPEMERLPFNCMGLRGSIACLTSNGFYKEETDDGAVFRLCCESEMNEETMIVCAVYEKTGDKLSLISMTKEPVSFCAGERVHSQKWLAPEKIKL